MPGKPVAEKLLLKPGKKVSFVNPPEGLDQILGELPEGVQIMESNGGPVDIVLVFLPGRQAMEELLPKLRGTIKPGGVLWAAYYKGTARVKTDIHRDILHDYAKSIGLQGVSLIALDEDCSAMRFKLV
jgi:predicted CoA-binding protein